MRPLARDRVPLDGPALDSGRLDALGDEGFQEALLQGVSRTFALTIPELPGPLASVVSNGYLLCRVADTIEDAPGLSPVEKQRMHGLLCEAIDAELEPGLLPAELAPLVASELPPAERELLRNVERVLRLTHACGERERNALSRCVRIMSGGMDHFQESDERVGLESIEELNAYCYFVAGVVGEMLTELFCAYSPAIDARRSELLARTVSFGQGLQMTNILKDIWEDRARGSCWLPREVFRRHGVDLAALGAPQSAEGFQAGLRDLIAIAHGHLREAFAYTLCIPAEERGIRRFCLRALGLAVLTLRKIRRHPEFRSAREVKVTRRAVRRTLRVCNLAVGSDSGLRLLFGLCSLGMPRVTPAAVGDSGRTASARPSRG